VVVLVSAGYISTCQLLPTQAPSPVLLIMLIPAADAMGVSIRVKHKTNIIAIASFFILPLLSYPIGGVVSLPV